MKTEKGTDGRCSRNVRLIMKLGLSFSALGALLAMTGCVGYVQGDRGGVVVAEPDVFLWGGYGGGYWGGYGHRGYESRGRR